MALRDIVAILLGIGVAAGAIFYGLAKLPPGDWRRWPLFAGGATMAVAFGWYPIVSIRVSVPLSATEQWAAVGLATVGLKFVAERIVPLFLLGVEDDDEPIQ